MSVIVTDAGFAPDDWAGDFLAPGEVATAGSDDIAVHLPPDADPAEIEDHLDRIALVRVAFPAFSDGRGFSIARALRLMGFRGRLRAQGHVIADQYGMARRAGFDEVEISDELALRQPQEHWLARADWHTHDYQARLRA